MSNMTLEQENEQLKQELKKLQNRLAVVQAWMEKEVKAQTHKIAKQKTKKLTSNIKEDFFKENIEEMIASRINNYF